MDIDRMNVDAISVQDRVVGLVRAILAENKIQADIEPGARLADVGLTSMDMVALMLRVESEFDFTIPQSAITPENFQSAEALGRMVAVQVAMRAHAAREA
jgi:acyl carrier protein